MKRYPKYKDSGIERFPEVPEGWQVVPCRSIVHELRFKNTKLQSTNYLSLMANIGVMPYEEKGDVGNKMPEDLTKCKIVSKGDFVINSMNYSIGSYGVSAYNGVCSPVYVILRPIEGRVLPTFASRIFECKSFQGNAQSHGNGILAHRCAIGWDILKALYVALPPISEQEKISVFLEAQLSQMDSAIESQERMIELLKERRSAIITQAVTKGLNPNAKMKDSGVPWLGQIPAHWEVKALKFVSRYNQYTLSDTTEPNTEIKYIEVSDVSQELGVKYFESMYFSDAPSRARRIVSEGDVIVSTVRTYLKAIAHIGPEHNKFICSTGFCVVRPISISPQFAKYALASDFFMSEVISRSSGVSYPAINAADLVRVKIAVPPLLEQQAISHYLFTEISALDLAINSQIKLIELLNERKSAIITQAVTGQIDVQ